jgi:transposase
LVIKATADDPELQERLEGLLALGDPDGEVAFAYSMKEAVAQFYDTADPEAAADLLRDIIDVGSKRSAPFEVRRLARTLRNWFESIVAWHVAKVSNGPTEGMNNLLKRVKRVAFGFTNFENFRIRALLYAGKPNVRVLDSIVVT